jgi:hypothetical protein
MQRPPVILRLALGDVVRRRYLVACGWPRFLLRHGPATLRRGLDAAVEAPGLGPAGSPKRKFHEVGRHLPGVDRLDRNPAGTDITGSPAICRLVVTNTSWNWVARVAAPDQHL